MQWVKIKLFKTYEGETLILCYKNSGILNDKFFVLASPFYRTKMVSKDVYWPNYSMFDLPFTRGESNFKSV